MPHAIPAGWAEANNVLSRTVERADFVEALAFVVEVGKLAEAANHHPDIAIRGYRTVHLQLTTHSAGNTITAKDLALAEKINQLGEQAVRRTKDELARLFAA
jgi:4a-hydroxytetrahydrobiopterin dehydratase